MTRLKWRHAHDRKDIDTMRATCGQYDCQVDYDNDACWTYSIEVGCSTVREFGDYVRSFGSHGAAQEACERWLMKQTKRQIAALKLTLKEKV